MIKVQDMMKAIRETDAKGRPRVFSVQVATADRQRKTGGKILDLPKVILLTKQRQSDRFLLVQPVGAKDVIRLHLDLILFFNNQEVV